MSAITMTNWRRAILAHQISELTALKLAAFSDTGGIFYRTPPRVQALIAKATLCLEAGRLDESERHACAAERGLIRHGRKFWAAIAARESVQPLPNEMVA
jgi:hypothetical protein